MEFVFIWPIFEKCYDGEFRTLFIDVFTTLTSVCNPFEAKHTKTMINFEKQIINENYGTSFWIVHKKNTNKVCDGKSFELIKSFVTKSNE